jgi:hypothetical protein
MPVARRTTHWQWIRETVNNATPNGAINNVDLLSGFKAHAGITINLPEIVIWRIRLQISIKVTVTNPTVPNDGVLATVFVDGTNQTLLNQVSNAMDEKDMIYDFLYVYETVANTDNVIATATAALYRNMDIRVHRKLSAIDSTLFLQLASSGTAVINLYSYSSAILVRLGR